MRGREMDADARHDCSLQKPINGSEQAKAEALCRTRTDDPFLTMEVLYQLS